MTKLRTEEQYKFGQTNIIPVAGEVKISEEGIIEVDDAIAQDVVNSNCGFSFLEGEEPAKQEDQNIGQEEEEDLSKKQEDDFNKEEEDLLEKASSDAQPSLEDIKAELGKSTLAELKELAKPFPSAEWRTLVKDDLIEYLASKTV